jgi:hypothetical protein
MRTDLPSEPTYWDIIRTHYLPTSKRLERWARDVARVLPSLETFEFRFDDAEEHPDVPENPTPLVLFCAQIEPYFLIDNKIQLKKQYYDRVPEGSPDVEGFEDQGYNGF